MSSKFLTESTGEKNVKIGKYLAKIWPKYDSLVFLGHPFILMGITFVLWRLLSHSQGGADGSSRCTFYRMLREVCVKF